MTVIDTTHRTTRRPDVLSVGPARLLAGARRDHRVDLIQHRALHRAAPALGRDDLAALAGAVHLVGRGGGAFPVARKLLATPTGRHTHVVVNGSESEPASLKDRTVMRHAPHLVIDGALLVARALGTTGATITVHDAESEQSLLRARAERPDAGSIRVDRSSTGFVGGEARSVVNRLSGHAPVPGGRRLLPSTHGVDDRPTFLSNVETFAQLAWLGSHGAVDFAATGTAAEPGTTLVTLLGDVQRPGVVEVPHGTRIDTLTGRPGSTVLIGGYHGRWGVDAGLTVERGALGSIGLAWGAGVVAVLPETTCPWGEVTRVARWMSGQSTGQCGPCVFGLSSIADDADLVGRGDPAALQRLRRRLGLVTGRGACAHPDGTSRFIASALQVFAEDVDRHAQHGHCGRHTAGALPIGEVRR